ncbi:type II toxin-antitoxin system VapC family toxin [Kiritimatiellaeota bacterium B1221]|nr:type II toxin-antitoxin system VapC family toxin [Kiritimatiellaeota bacterium B1221]
MLKANSSIVLDAHAWLWLINGNPRVASLSTHVGRMAISAISIWEIGMLVDKKRLVLEPTVKVWIQKYLRAPFTLQPLSSDISLRAASLSGFHGDPADSMIVATALELGQVLVTADRAIQQWYFERPEYEQLLFAL